MKTRTVHEVRDWVEDLVWQQIWVNASYRVTAPVSNMAWDSISTSIWLQTEDQLAEEFPKLLNFS